MTSKYFKYALGEIALVVLGILIALSINNWNENLKQTKKIQQALKEIQNDLEKDVLILENETTLKKEDIEAQLRVISALEHQLYEKEQIEKDLGRVMLTRDVVITDAGFEYLKAIGIAFIEDRELRNMIVQYYEMVVPDLALDIVDDDDEFTGVWLPYVREHFIDWNFGSFGIPKDPQELIKDQYFLTSLKINYQNALSTLEKLETTFKIAQQLYEKIESVLN